MYVCACLCVCAFVCLYVCVLCERVKTCACVLNIRVMKK
jgi:hypothetical protein